MRKPYNTMKNTSLSVPLGNAKGTPSAEPPEAKLLSATDRARVIGAGSLEAPNRLLQKGTQFIPEQHKIDNAKSENRSLEDFPFCIVYFVCAHEAENGQNFFSREKVGDFFQWEKICSFSHFRWSNTQAGKAGEASQVSTVVLYILSVFLTADAPDICEPLVLYTKTDTTPIYLIFHVKQTLNVPIC